ncbi:hypothetical protein [uncultured Bacteroides sp.]|uniref:hypothetical protein n=1 Tax=uncultured Bacteroides sp. TaxID=162156 RepID=UPI002AAB3972|nr:hypothetical protein [uncultured Bacteroides sp.]
MSTMDFVLSLESSNEDCIFLFREGIFYKAYERSAFAFVTGFASFAVKKRYVKRVGSEVVSIGFPIASLLRHFNSKDVQESPDGVTVQLNKAIDVQAFENWKSEITFSEVKKALPKEEFFLNEREIITKLKSFH